MNGAGSYGHILKEKLYPMKQCNTVWQKTGVLFFFEKEATNKKQANKDWLKENVKNTVRSFLLWNDAKTKEKAS